MIRISTRGRYGLRAMVQLAEAFETGPVLMRTIAAEQDISLKYLHAVLTTLKGAGLVRSVRGAHGGYSLARPPSKITAKEVVQALEGSLAPVACVADGGLCERAESCAVRNLWRDLGNAIDSTLSGVTLADLMP